MEAVDGLMILYSPMLLLSLTMLNILAPWLEASVAFVLNSLLQRPVREPVRIGAN